MRIIVLLMIPILVFPISVVVYHEDDLDGIPSAVEKILEDRGYEVVPFEKFEEKLVSITNMPSNLRLIFAAKLMGIDEIFFLKREKDLIKFKRIFVKQGEVFTVFESKSDEFIDRFIDFLKGGEDLKVDFKIEVWKEGKLYKRGDLVRFKGEIYKSMTEHVSSKNNSPNLSKFWKKLTPKIVLGYFPSWGIYSKGFRLKDVRAELLTHVVYAFANISDEGLCVVGDPYADLGIGEDGSCERLGGNLSEIYDLRRKNPDVKILISVGGWNWSKNFSKVASTKEGRERFAKSCVDLFIMGNFGKCGEYPGLFDGIDIDWEFPVSGGKYPGSEKDRENFTLLVKTLREELDRAEKTLNRRLILSIAGGSSPEYIFKNTKLDEISKYLDFIVVMTYDFKGPWSSTTGFHNAMYGYEDPDSMDFNVDTVVHNYIEAGVPREKILVGVPFYGRSWSGVPEKNDGLNQPFRGLGPGTIEGGILDYKDIVNRYEKRLEKHFHPIAQVPWLYGNGIFITYEDRLSASVKALYVLENDLAGVAIWELSCDTEDERSLLRTLSSILLGR